MEITRIDIEGLKNEISIRREQTDRAENIYRTKKAEFLGLIEKMLDTMPIILLQSGSHTLVINFKI